jgi:hypothetical protein
MPPQSSPARTGINFKFAPDIRPILDRLKERHGGNRTAALEALVRDAAGPTLTLMQAPGDPGLWVPATLSDWGVEISLNKARPGDRSDQEGRIPRLIARAAEAGVTVVFRAGSPEI